MRKKDQPEFTTLLADTAKTTVFYGVMSGFIGATVISMGIPAGITFGYVYLTELLQKSLRVSEENTELFVYAVATITMPLLLAIFIADSCVMTVAGIGGILGALLAVPYAITAQLTRKFQENAEIESAIKYLRSVRDKKTQESIIKEIIAHDNNSPIGLRSKASLELKSSLYYSGDWKALLDYMTDKTDNGVYRHNGKKLFRAVQASETLIAGRTGIQREDGELRKQLQLLTQEDVRQTRTERQDSLRFIFIFLFSATEEKIRRCDLDVIFSSKNNLKSELKSYINTLDLQQLQLLSDPKNMLGKLIDHQTARLLKTRHTDTRLYVNNLLAEKISNIPVAIRVTTSPAIGVPVLTEWNVIIALDNAINKLKESELDYFGKEARRQKRLVLEAAKSVLHNTITDDEFVRTLSANPEYTHTFKPGKEAQTVKLVHQLVALRQSLKQKLQTETTQLEKAYAAKKTVSFFNRKDPVLSALEAANNPLCFQSVTYSRQGSRIEI